MRRPKATDRPTDVGVARRGTSRLLNIGLGPRMFPYSFGLASAQGGRGSASDRADFSPWHCHSIQSNLSIHDFPFILLLRSSHIPCAWLSLRGRPVLLRPASCLRGTSNGLNRAAHSAAGAAAQSPNTEPSFAQMGTRSVREAWEIVNLCRGSRGKEEKSKLKLQIFLKVSVHRFISPVAGKGKDGIFMSVKI